MFEVFAVNTHEGCDDCVREQLSVQAFDGAAWSLRFSVFGRNWLKFA